MKNKMLLFSCVVCALCFFASNAGAQTKVGVKLQGASASVTTNEDRANDAIDRKLAFGIGLMAWVGVHDYVAIQPELLYANRGYKIDLRPDLEADTVLSLNYIQAPILVSLKFPLGFITPHLAIGPYLAYALGGENTSTLVIGGKESSRTVEVERDDISGFDAGVVVAPGVNVAFGEFTLNVGLRWERGLIDISNDDRDDDYIHHTALSVNIGVLFEL